MSSDKTELGIEAITEDMEPEQRTAMRRMMRRNSMVAKAMIWVTMALVLGFLTALGAYFMGLN